ncbi:MAG: hypothetical protein IT304_10285 [Dehalococcoidia bacterium]|nr:hypothetical protein [Dehalococcoidia bacterium]
MTTVRHPTQAELLTGAIRTLEEILLPELQTPWAKSSTVQLAGLLQYALARQRNDLQAQQDAELRASLEQLLTAEPGLAKAAGATRESFAMAEGAELRRAAGALLVFAQEQPENAAAAAVRGSLRPLLVRQTAEDLAEAGPLLEGFMSGFRARPADEE